MPRVSIIVPCLNEEKTIALLLDAIYHQTFPRAEMEVILADGLSADRTRQRVADYQQAHPDLSIRMVDNPRRIIPIGLNLALKSSQGEWIVRLDAHSVPAPDYVERCVADLEAGLGENVGGVWHIQPGGPGWLAQSIAAAAAHPLGVGDAMYRLAASASEVDTVPFGAFRRSLVDRIGPFDETLLTNEDYEFNTRIRQRGGKVWLDPAIHSVYFARSDLAALARQYFRYGFWKFQMLRRYPETVRWRQALPPLFVGSLLFWGVLSLFWIPARAMLGLEITVYGLALLFAGGFAARKRRRISLVVGLPLGIATMHFSWGGGFLASMVKSLVK
jgi:succinoglycan biosynthesis protein ExoA